MAAAIEKNRQRTRTGQMGDGDGLGNQRRQGNLGALCGGYHSAEKHDSGGSH